MPRCATVTPRGEALAASARRLSMVEKKAEDPILNSVVAGRYEVYAKLGEGGMGAVYAARQAPLGRTVALKVLLKSLSQDPIAIKRFEKEALAISRLAHPNTVTIFDFGTTEQGLMYIAMEFLEGRALRDVIAHEAPLSPRRVVRILAQMVRALSEAHQRGVIHRDLKPDNIMLVPTAGEPDFVKVLDFGVAKLRAPEGGPAVKTLTQGDVIFGTPRYMSPEQVNGIMDDPRSDLYAVGAIAYEMLAGTPVFDGDSAMTILIKQVQEAPRPFARLGKPVQVPEALEGLVLKLLSKDRAQRVQSADALLQALDELPVLGGGLRPQSGRTEAMARPMLTPDATPRVGTEMMGSNFARPPSAAGPPPAAETQAMPVDAPATDPQAQTTTEPPRSPAAAPPPRAAVAPATTARTAADTTVDEPLAPPRSRAPLWLGLGAAGLALVAVLAWQLAGDTPAPLPEEPAAPVEARARLEIAVDPAGAAVLIDGEPVGTAPINVLVSTGRSHQVEALLAGHAPLVRQVAIERDTRLSLTLLALVADAGARAVGAATDGGARPGAATGPSPRPDPVRPRPDATAAVVTAVSTPDPSPALRPDAATAPLADPGPRPKPKPGTDPASFEKFDDFKEIE